MFVRHLTDEEIQNYLDKNTAADGAFVEEHIEMCRGCRETFSHYKNLYEMIRECETEFTFPDNFAEVIISKASPSARISSDFILSDTMIGIIGAVIVSLPLIYYNNSKFVRDFWVKLLPSVVTFGHAFFSTLKLFCEYFGENLSLLVSVGLVLGIAYAIDKLVIQPKLKRITCVNAG